MVKAPAKSRRFIDGLHPNKQSSLFVRIPNPRRFLAQRSSGPRGVEVVFFPLLRFYFCFFLCIDFSSFEPRPEFITRIHRLFLRLGLEFSIGEMGFLFLFYSLDFLLSFIFSLVPVGASLRFRAVLVSFLNANYF